MKRTPAAAALLLAVIPGSAASGLIGFGIEMYNPLCAFSCRAAIASAPLACTDHSIHSGGHEHGGGGPTTPECRANDTPFLTTLAYCINSTCAESGVDAWKLEKYWKEKTTDDPTVVPKWTYAQTLEHITGIPVKEVPEEETLDFTAVVPHELWDTQKRTMELFEKQETLHSTYAYVVEPQTSTSQHQLAL